MGQLGRRQVCQRAVAAGSRLGYKGNHVRLQVKRVKTILVPVTENEGTRSILETAWLIARRFGSTVEGFGLRRIRTEYVPVDMVGGVTWPVGDLIDKDAPARAHELFRNFAHEAGAVEPAVPIRWFADAPPGDEIVGSYGRIFDLTVVGRPVAGQPEPAMATLESALFESGRPIMIAPPRAPKSIGDTIVLAWNGSSETARTTAFAMPFLVQAQRVVVLSVEGGMVPGPSGHDLVRTLRLHGIPAEELTVGADRRSTGEAVLDTAGSLGADLLIKGAYTQSRIRQMIFGGTTSHILAAAEIPVLMAH